eukprot:s7788_g4.t1
MLPIVGSRRDSFRRKESSGEAMQDLLHGKHTPWAGPAMAATQDEKEQILEMQGIRPGGFVVTVLQGGGISDFQD